MSEVDVEELRRLAEAGSLAAGISASDISRFFNKVETSDGCWIWKASTSGHPRRQYGCFYLNGRAIKAHQFAHLVFKGELRAGKIVCHHCDNPICVNPDHLYLGTHRDNVRDALDRGRHSNGQSKKTHCANGHAYDEGNTYRYKGARQCQICRNKHRAASKMKASMAYLSLGDQP